MKGPARLFVYGTLRPGGRAPAPLRSLLRTRARRIGEGTVAGKLLDAGAFPAAVELSDTASGNRPRVRGVVYALDAPDEVLRAVDDYEGVRPEGGGLFRRDVVRVRLDGGDDVRAWIYWYERDAGDHPAVPGGDWRKRRSDPDPGPGG